MGTANKLRTYRANTLNYTTIVNDLQDVSDFKQRKSLPKLRASSHKLNIEAGRHNKLTLNKRFDKFCNVNIEDENISF